MPKKLIALKNEQLVCGQRAAGCSQAAHPEPVREAHSA